MIISIIGLVIGAFVGYLLTDFLGFLDPARKAIRSALDSGRSALFNATASLAQGKMIATGILILLLLLILWMISFVTALVLGFILGVVYNDTVESLPFVSSLAGNIKSKLKNNNSDK